MSKGVCVCVCVLAVTHSRCQPDLHAAHAHTQKEKPSTGFVLSHQPTSDPCHSSSADVDPRRINLFPSVRVTRICRSTTPAPTPTVDVQ